MLIANSDAYINIVRDIKNEIEIAKKSIETLEQIKVKGEKTYAEGVLDGKIQQLNRMIKDLGYILTAYGNTPIIEQFENGEIRIHELQEFTTAE